MKAALQLSHCVMYFASHCTCLFLYVDLYHRVRWAWYYHPRKRNATHDYCSPLQSVNYLYRCSIGAGWSRLPSVRCKRLGIVRLGRTHPPSWKIPETSRSELKISLKEGDFKAMLKYIHSPALEAGCVLLERLERR